MSGSTRSTRSTPMTSGAVPPAVKTFLTEYTVQQNNRIVDTIPAVVNETLRDAELADVPKIAEMVDKLMSEAKEGVPAEVARTTTEIPTLVQKALEDYQISQATRDADRLDATKKELLTWFQENLHKQVAPLVAAAVEPDAQKVKKLSLALYAMKTGEMQVPSKAPGRASALRTEEASIDKEYGDRESGNMPLLRSPGPGHGGGSESGTSDRSRKSRRGSRKNRSRSRRDRDRDGRRSNDGYSSDETDSLKSSGYDSDRGPRVSSFRPWKPTDHRFHKACDYRTYRLEQGRGRMDVRTNRNTRKKVKDLEVTMAGHKFDGKDPIKVIGFLRRLKRDADRNDMTESSLFLALPYMLRGEAQDAFEAAQDDGHSRRSVQDWTTACDWLLRTYATNANIADALMDLSRTRQSAEEDETKYSTRLRNAVKRCGNVHSEYEVATLFVQGLIPSISPRVAQVRSSKPRIEYVELVQTARSEGDAVRAQGRLVKPRVNFADKLPRRTVNFVSDEVDDGRSTVTRTGSLGGSATEVHLVGDGGESVSAPSYFSATETDSTDAEAFYANHTRFQKNRYDRFRRDAPVQRGQTIICHDCYLPGHISPRCEMKLKDLYQVPINYGKLTEEQRSHVPDASYRRAVAALKPSVPEGTPDDAASPKN